MKGCEPKEAEKALPLPRAFGQQSEGTQVPENPFDQVEHLDPPTPNEAQVAEGQQGDSEPQDGQAKEEEKEDEDDFHLPELFYWPTIEVMPQEPTTATSPDKAEEIPLTPRSFGDAMDYIYSWFKPLFSPIAHFALHSRREAVKSLKLSAEDGAKIFDEIKEEDRKARGAKAAVDIFIKNTYDQQPNVATTRPPGTTGIWRALYTVKLPDGTVM